MKPRIVWSPFLEVWVCGTLSPPGMLGWGHSPAAAYEKWAKRNNVA